LNFLKTLFENISPASTKSRFAHIGAHNVHIFTPLVRAQLGFWEHCDHIKAADAPIPPQI
jgi:hypothetical protein